MAWLKIYPRCFARPKRLRLAKVAAAEAQGDFNRIDQMRLVSPKGHILDAPLQTGQHGEHSYVAPRMVIDAMLQEHAVASGAEFLAAQVQEPLIENGRVVGVRAKMGQNGGQAITLRARLVIGADGVTRRPAVTFAYQALAHFDACFPYLYLRQVDNGYGGRVRFTYAHDGRLEDRYGARVAAAGDDPIQRAHALAALMNRKRPTGKRRTAGVSGRGERGVTAPAGPTSVR